MVKWLGEGPPPKGWCTFKTCAETCQCRQVRPTPEWAKRPVAPKYRYLMEPRQEPLRPEPECDEEMA